MRPLPQLGQEPEVPSPALPLAFFAAAAAWLAVGSAGLIAVAPDLAAGVWQQPRVFAVTHAFTLGVIASAIFGALHQFVPAVMGVPIRYPRVAWWGFWLTETGVALLLIGFWRWRPALQAVAWTILLAAVGAASFNTLPARRRALRNRRVGLYVSLGHSALGLGMLIALIRIGDGLGWWLTSRDGLLAAHFHLGVVGFGTLTAMGMTSRMLPAFLDAEGTPDDALDWIGWVLSGSLIVHAAGTILGHHGLIRLGGLGMLVSIVAHLAILARYFRRRARRSLDPGLGFIASASTGYLLAALAGAGLLIPGSRPGRAWVAYAVLAILGWLVTLVIGVMHRVVPRLVSGYRARKGQPLTGAERGAALLRPGPGWIACATWGAGVAMVTGGILAGELRVTSAGAWLVATGAGLVAIEGLWLLRRPGGAGP